MFRSTGQTRTRYLRVFALLALALALGYAPQVRAQSNTRLLLSSGWGVPEHAGFVFGPFSHLAMNEAKEAVFLTTLRGSRSDLRAVIRSTGVTFSVVAFEGLRSPVPRASYESFSAPSINRGGVIAFTATLKDEVPTSAVIRVEGMNAKAVVVSGASVPGHPDATFQEFSAPVINSVGSILFGARTGGKQPGTGLFLWTPRGIQTLTLPAGLTLTPKDVLRPVYFSHDEAVFVLGQNSSAEVLDQFFRAVATRNFQELTPPPAAAETVEVLPARLGVKPVKMLLVLMEGEEVGTVALEGDPSQPVIAKRAPGPPLKPLGRIYGQTTGPRGNIIFAATPADAPSDLALYCFCEGQVIRQTSPEEFLPITEVSRETPILSLTSDSQHTTAFIAPGGEGGDSTAIYVTSVP